MDSDKASARGAAAAGGAPGGVGLRLDKGTYSDRDRRPGYVPPEYLGTQIWHKLPKKKAPARARALSIW